MKLKEKIANTKEYLQKHQKKFILVMCCVVIFGGLVAGTLAWLVSKSGPVVNSFIGSNLVIDLEETQRQYPMIPDLELDKDPQVTVKSGSEACWLFIQVKESICQANGSGIKVTEFGQPETPRNGPEYKYLEYDIIPYDKTKDIGWIPIDSATAESYGFPVRENGVVVNTYYYRPVGDEGADLPQDLTFDIITLDKNNLTDDTKNKVRVNQNIINAELDADWLAQHPVTITFTPAAVQRLGFDVADAAKEISGMFH